MQKLKELSLILSGALLGISPSLLVSKDPTSWNIQYKVGFFLFTAFLLLVGFGLIDWITKIYDKTLFSINSRRNMVGVYAPMKIISQRNESWIDIDLETILKQVEKVFKKTKILKTTSAFSRYKIILNPYGGVYYEHNAPNYGDFKKILRFVRNGGIFVNIADIPFYYAYNPVLGRRIDTTPLAAGLRPIRSFYHSLLSQELSTFIVGVNSLPKVKNLDVERLFILHETSENLWETHYPDAEGHPMSPFVAVPYGNGFFVLSTFHINNSNKTWIQKIMKQVKSISKNGV